MNRFALLLSGEDYRGKLSFLKDWPACFLRWQAPFQLEEKIEIISPQAQALGEIIYCSLGAESSADLGKRKMVKAICLAAKKGISHVSLSSRFMAFQQAGHLAAQKVGISLSTGFNLRTFLLLNELEQIIKLKGEPVNLVIWGLANPLGQFLTRVLARQNRSITLITATKVVAEKLAEQILYETGLAVKITPDHYLALNQADLVVIATKLEPHVLSGQDFKVGAFLFNFVLPQNDFLKKTLLGPSVFLREEILVKVPGKLPEGLAWSGETCSPAWAETMLLALEKREQPFAGEIARWYPDIGDLFRKHGFKVVTLGGTKGKKESGRS